MSIAVPWIQVAEIRKAAEEVLFQYHPRLEIPVPIDIIIERDYGIDIVPVAGLKEEMENDAFISRDFTTIHVDQHIYFNVEVRYRFSLAHELGHRILHRRIFQELKFATIDEWIEVYQSIDADNYGRLEYQANTFAGYLLIPESALDVEFSSAVSSLKDQLSQAKGKGISREMYLEPVIGSISRKLAPGFNVSVICMENRLKNAEKCKKMIP